MRWLCCAFAVACSSAAPAWAGTTTTSTLGSSVLVISACTVSGTTLQFGTALNPVAAGPFDASSTLTVQCTYNTSYSISLNAGINTGGGTNFAGRVLTSGSYSLPYQLYVDSNRTQIWGNGTSSSVYSSSGTGNAQSVSIYGRLPSLTGFPPGTYTDTVTVTVSY